MNSSFLETEVIAAPDLVNKTNSKTLNVTQTVSRVECVTNSITNVILTRTPKVIAMSIIMLVCLKFNVNCHIFLIPVVGKLGNSFMKISRKNFYGVYKNQNRSNFKLQTIYKK